MSLLLALLPLLKELFAGTAVAAALGTITFAQWVAIGIKALEAGPEVMQALSKLHPAFEQLMTDLTRNGNPQEAAGNLRNWLAANADAAIKLQPGAIA